MFYFISVEFCRGGSNKGFMGRIIMIRYRSRGIEEE